jgi:hypothetical protein
MNSKIYGLERNHGCDSTADRVSRLSPKFFSVTSISGCMGRSVRFFVRPETGWADIYNFRFRLVHFEEINSNSSFTIVKFTLLSRGGNHKEKIHRLAYRFSIDFKIYRLAYGFLCVNHKGLAKVYRFLVRAFFSRDFKNP